MNATPTLNRLAMRTYRFANREGRNPRLGMAAVSGLMRLYYAAGKPPWDSGTTPRELTEVVEGPQALSPGRALELGCGTGTNAVYLARHGWDVVGVDLVERAVRQARRKAREAGVEPRLVTGDATRLPELSVGGEFSLFFDLSCYCGIPVARRDAYADGVTRLAAPGAVLLMFAYGEGAPGTCATADDLRARFSGWELIDATPGTNSFPTWWFTLRRR